MGETRGVSEQLVKVDIADHIAVIRLNRPGSLNAISGAMADQVTDAFERVSDDNDVWVVVLLAEGDRAFCVGADLKERAGFSLDEFYRNRDQIRSMFAAVRDTPQPVVCGVFGFALGGGFELALSCDMVIAAQDTQFGLPETRVGLIPAGGGTQLLTRKVGTSRAKEMIFRGRRFDEKEAQQLGIVADTVGRDKLEEWTMETARYICKGSPVAVREAKRAIDEALGVPLREGIEVEHEAWRVVIESEDRSEGIAAFNEKRDPDWKNR